MIQNCLHIITNTQREREREKKRERGREEREIIIIYLPRGETLIVHSPSITDI